MTSIKDKLTNSVRQARSAQAPAAKRAAPAKPAAKAAPKAASKPASASTMAKSSANDPKPSGSALFPQRIWPD